MAHTTMSSTLCCVLLIVVLLLEQTVYQRNVLFTKKAACAIGAGTVGFVRVGGAVATYLNVKYTKSFRALTPIVTLTYLKKLLTYNIIC